MSPRISRQQLRRSRRLCNFSGSFSIMASVSEATPAAIWSSRCRTRQSGPSRPSLPFLAGDFDLRFPQRFENPGFAHTPELVLCRFFEESRHIEIKHGGEGAKSADLDVSVLVMTVLSELAAQKARRSSQDRLLLLEAPIPTCSKSSGSLAADHFLRGCAAVFLALLFVDELDRLLGRLDQRSPSGVLICGW